ncbi:lysine 2,3-aminomutase [Bacillus luteolus]|uniref:Lysine 2,3-aminomutase n=1 Tax=Litchfieldia luteola TaxID=682179 RepID=A0ABR9QNI0_9BACI|nr:lysine 2,3-aminomutase [Cytobacillus luteolus]
MFLILPLKNAVPTFVVDAPGGGGKISVQPNYIISQSAEKVVLRNFEGVITSYLEPQNYVAGRAEGYFKSVYPENEKYKSNVGISAVMNDSKFNLVPEGLKHLDRRNKYEEDPSHASLKDKREKLDELKEKKFLSEQQKSTGYGEQDKAPAGNE